MPQGTSEGARSAPLSDGDTQVIEAADSRGDKPQSFQEAVREVGEGSELGYRLKQQAIVSDFGLYALTTRNLDDLLHRACELCAAGMHSGLCKIMEHERGGDLLIRAGVGWRAGVVGHVRIGADLASPAGFALKTGKPVISNHLHQEDRFRTPQVMAEHGVRRAVNVLINTSSIAWGVLEVDSSNAGQFEAADIAFLQGFANLIGVAIERQLGDEALEHAIAHQKLLVREASHRVKNSLALLTSVLRLQSRRAASSDVAEALDDASGRIIAVAQAHDQIWRETAENAVDLQALVMGLCDSLRKQFSDMTLIGAADPLFIRSDAAVALALFLTEAVTNSAKHASEAPGGRIDLTASVEGERIAVCVRDNGPGYPENFSLQTSAQTSLGMRLLVSLAKQLQGELKLETDGGAVLTLSLPKALSIDSQASA